MLVAHIPPPVAGNLDPDEGLQLVTTKTKKIGRRTIFFSMVLFNYIWVIKSSAHFFQPAPPNGLEDECSMLTFIGGSEYYEPVIIH